MSNQTLDPGHCYKLLSLDGEHDQTLQFVKRFDPQDPSRFPGNYENYPGTTMQAVIRCIIDRVDYLQNQIPHQNNIAIRLSLMRCLWLLEHRAAQRHGYRFSLSIDDTFSMPMCPHCGHVICEQLGNAKLV